MNDFKIEQSNNSFFLKIADTERLGCAQVFVGGVGVLMFLLPIVVTIFIMKGLTFGGMISWSIAWFISGY